MKMGVFFAFLGQKALDVKYKKNPQREVEYGIKRTLKTPDVYKKCSKYAAFLDSIRQIPNISQQIPAGNIHSFYSNMIKIS